MVREGFHIIYLYIYMHAGTYIHIRIYIYMYRHTHNLRIHHDSPTCNVAFRETSVTEGPRALGSRADGRPTDHFDDPKTLF